MSTTHAELGKEIKALKKRWDAAPTSIEIGKMAIQMRDKLQMNQREIAERFGCSKQYVSKVIRLAEAEASS